MISTTRSLSLFSLFLSAVSASAILEEKLGVIQIAYRPASNQSPNHRLGVKSPQVICPEGEKECGVVCIYNDYTCCTTTPDESGGCAPGTECQKGANGKWGCCPVGKVCFGNGGAVTHTIIGPVPTTGSDEGPHFVIPTIHMPPPFSKPSIHLPPDISSPTPTPEVSSDDNDEEPIQSTDSNTLPTQIGDNDDSANEPLATSNAGDNVDPRPSDAGSTVTVTAGSATAPEATSDSPDLVSEGWMVIAAVVGIIIGGLVL